MNETMSHELFLTLAAIGVLLLVIIPFLGHWRETRQGPGYIRSSVYRVWMREHEFRIYGIYTLAEADQLITYLLDAYNLEIIEHDPEPDESYWILAGAQGTIQLFYDDHEGVRIRTVQKSKRGLFQWLLRDLPRRRIFPF